MNHIKNNWYMSVAFIISIICIVLFNIPVTLFTPDKELAFRDFTMTWNATHYAINYTDFGFVKRGLIGSFYNLVNGSFTQESLFLFQSFFIILLIVVTHFFFSKLGLQKSFIYVLFMVSPATFMQFGSDLGRFDCILVTVFLLSVMYRKSSLLFFIFSTLGILIHEIYVFALLPAAFLIHLSDRVDSMSLTDIFVGSIKNTVLYFLLLSIIIVVSLGGYEAGYEQILNTFSKSKLPSSYIEFHTSNATGRPLEIWTRSIAENIEYTSKRFTLSIPTIYMMIIYLALLVYFNILGVTFNKPKYYLILLSSFPMFLLGTDWGRWLAFIYMSIFIIFITTERDKAAGISNKRLFTSSLYGPLGVGGFLPPLPAKVYIFLKQII